MFFPESLYLLSARDQQVTWLDPVLFRSFLSTAAAGVNTPNFTVPDGRTLILTSASCFASPTGGQVATFGDFRAQGPDLVDISIAQEQPNPALGAGVPLILNWSGQIIVPPRWNVYFRGSFNAGVAANSVAQHLFGILIPVANVQRI